MAQDITALGGDLSSTLADQNAIQVAAPNVEDLVKRNKQIAGFTPFHRTFTKKNGLGRAFINDGCGNCHINNGKGRVRLHTDPNKNNAMVIKVSLRGEGEDGAPIDVPRFGEQLQDKTFRKKRFRLRLRWERIAGIYPDGTTFRLRSPRVLFRIPGVRRKNVVHSLRMTPGLIGLGLLESIPESAILVLSDPEDSDGDGISGVPAYVPDRESGTFKIGRFGFRGSQPSVAMQSAAAAFLDMGVSNTYFPGTGEAPELNDKIFEELVIYQLIPGVPFARDQESPVVQQGKALFQSTGCNSCHVMEFITENPDHPELDGQKIHPFTDLLLHDMGPGLADERAEFSASGSDWRTTPLWGLGFLDRISKVPQRYLHDGRARTLEEAILWHGGEAEKSKMNFMNLAKAERDALIAFLNSL